MRTITKTITKAVSLDTTIISDLSQIVEILHNMAAFPRYKVINMYGTEWETVQNFLKSRLESFYEFHNGTIQVDLVDFQTGEVLNEYYTITRSALLETARDGVMAVPYLEYLEMEV